MGAKRRPTTVSVSSMQTSRTIIPGIVAARGSHSNGGRAISWVAGFGGGGRQPGTHALPYYCLALLRCSAARLASGFSGWLARGSGD